jgi:hypothetical protein
MKELKAPYKTKVLSLVKGLIAQIKCCDVEIW